MTRGQYASTTEICAHRIVYRFWTSDEKDIPVELHERLDEEAESRVKHMIPEGYRSGELNYEDEDVSLRGWWEISDD